MRPFQKIFIFFHIFIFHLGRSPITMKPFLKNLCVFQKPNLCIFHQLGKLPEIIRPHAKNLHNFSPSSRLFGTTLPFFQKKIKRKEEEGFSHVFSLQTYHTKPKEKKRKGFHVYFLYKLTIQSQKKMNFPMPLYRKYCKKGGNCYNLILTYLLLI
jgi:hypothetical protein